MLIFHASREDDWLERLAFAADGRSLAAAGFHGVYWWELPGGRVVHFAREYHPDPARVIVPTGGTVFFRDYRGIHHGDPTAGVSALMVPLPLSSAYGSQMLLTATHAVSFERTDTNRTTVTGWSHAGTDRPAWSLTVTKEVERPLTLPEADWFLTVEYLRPVRDRWAERPGTFRVVRRRLADGKPVGRPQKFLDGPRVSTEARLSPDGKLVAGLTSGNLSVQPTAGGDRVVIDQHLRLAVTGVAFHPGGHYLAATNNDATVRVYRVRTWELAHTFTWAIGRMRSVAFSPDGTLAAAGSDAGKVVVWDFDG